MKPPSTVPSLVSVKSSNVKAVGYDPKSNSLYIQYLPDDENQYGPLYKYDNVPEMIFNQLLRAPSKGIFVWTKIRERYSYSKWTGFGWRKEAALKKQTVRRKKSKQYWRKK